MKNYFDAAGAVVAMAASMSRRLLNPLLCLLLFSCVVPADDSSTQKAADDFATTMEQARQSVGLFYWSGDTWRGDTHDAAKPICSAIVTAPDEVSTFESKGGMLYDALCIPQGIDFPGLLTFKLGNDEPILVTHFMRGSSLMRYRLAQSISAKPVRVSEQDRVSDEGAIGLAADAGGDWHTFALSGAIRELGNLGLSFAATGRWSGQSDECGASLLPGAVILSPGPTPGEEEVTLFGTLEGVDNSCDDEVKGRQSRHASYRGSKFEPLFGAAEVDPLQGCRDELTREEHQAQCVVAVRQALLFVTNEQAADMVSACDAMHWIDDEATLGCIQKASVSRHAMGHVVRACKAAFTSIDLRHQCIDVGAAAPSEQHECCLANHRTRAEYSNFADCLAESGCEPSAS